MSHAGLLQAASSRSEQYAHTGTADICVDDLRLRPVVTPTELACIMPLRRQIALPGAVRADPGFLALEKKEIPSGWSSPLR